MPVLMTATPLRFNHVQPLLTHFVNWTAEFSQWSNICVPKLCPSVWVHSFACHCSAAVECIYLFICAWGFLFFFCPACRVFFCLFGFFVRCQFRPPYIPLLVSTALLSTHLWQSAGKHWLFRFHVLPIALTKYGSIWPCSGRYMWFPISATYHGKMWYRWVYVHTVWYVGFFFWMLLLDFMCTYTFSLNSMHSLISETPAP